MIELRKAAYIYGGEVVCAKPHLSPTRATSMITTTNLTDSDFVAEVGGFSLDDVKNEGVRRRLHYLWLKHQVLVFRGLDADNETQLANLSRVFGELEVHSRGEYLSSA